MAKTTEAVIRRTATEVVRYKRRMRLLAFFAVAASLFLILGYVVSVLYSKYGSFTVTVNKFDNLKYALTLSETPDFATKTARLNSAAEEDVTNIDGKTLPDYLDNIDGEHNGDNYVAYTFYCRNEGTEPLAYNYDLYIANMSFDIEKAARVRLYVNGEYTDYAYPRTDGIDGPEPGTTAFYNNNSITQGIIENFNPNDVTKYTVVIWLEGNDPDCVDKILGGQFKIDMAFTVVASENEK